MMREKIVSYWKALRGNPRQFVWLWEQTKPMWRGFVWLTVLQCVMSGVRLAVLYVNKRIIDQAQDAMPIMMLALLSAGLSVGTLCFQWIYGYGSTKQKQIYREQLRNSLFESVLHGNWSKRRQYHSAQLTTQMTEDVNQIADGMLDVLGGSVVAVVQLICAFGFMYRYDARLALVSLAVSPFAALLGMWSGSKMHGLHEQTRIAQTNSRVFLQEHVKYAEILAVFEQQENVQVEYQDLQKRERDCVMRQMSFRLLTNLGIAAIFSGTYLVVLCGSAVRLRAGSISFGTLTLCLNLVGMIQTAMYSFATLLGNSADLLVSLERVYAVATLYDVTEAPANVEGPLNLQIVNVSAGYTGEEPVVEHLQLDVPAGSLHVIRGMSGRGKTTFLRTVMGMLPPQKGTITVTDQRGSTVHCGSNLWSQISFVPQQYSLFRGTIRENLSVGNMNATESEMIDALERACAWEFVSLFPQKLDTVIGEDGIGLSLGQAQRIAYARALLKPCGLMILDEVTSALDEETECRLLTRWKEQPNRPTCLFVSHRSSVLDLADGWTELERT